MHVCNHPVNYQKCHVLCDIQKYQTYFAQLFYLGLKCVAAFYISLACPLSLFLSYSVVPLFASLAIFKPLLFLSQHNLYYILPSFFS